MKIKRNLLLFCVLLFSISFTGCGEALYAMTPEEEAIITLYASKTVSKFNKNQTTGIANARVKAGELEEIQQVEVEESNDIQEENPEVEVDPETGQPITPSAEEASEEAANPSEDTSYSLTSAINIEGVEFELVDFKVSPEYKASSSFILTESKGKQYVVLNLKATNTTGSSVDFSKYKGNSYSLSVNGKEKSSTQFTPLSNDLANFDGILAAGDSKNLVLVFLCSNSSVDNISSLALFVANGDTTRGTKL